MAFPVVAATNTAGGNPAPTFAVALPTGTIAGDLLIVQVTERLASGSAGITPPTGMTTLYNRSSGTKAMGLFWKIATSTDITNGSFTFSFSGTNSNSDSCSLGIARVSNYDPASAITASNDSFNTAGSITAVSNTGVSTVLQSLLLLFSGATASAAGRTLSGYAVANNNPSWTESFDISKSGSSGTNISQSALAWANGTAAGATGTASATYSSTVEVADLFIVAIQPPHTVVLVPFVLETAVNAPTFIRRMVAPALTAVVSIVAPIVNLVPPKWRNAVKHAADWTNEPKS